MGKGDEQILDDSFKGVPYRKNTKPLLALLEGIKVMTYTADIEKISMGCHHTFWQSCGTTCEDYGCRIILVP